MKSSIGDRLRRARERAELDQAALAARIGVATRTVQRWEKGEQIPDGVSITKMAKATGVQPSWLLTGEGDMHRDLSRPANVFTLNPARKNVRMVELPLVSYVRGGKLASIFHPDHVEDYITVADVKDPQAFALKVKGESMAPKIEDGDTVIVSPQKEVHSGDICIVRVGGEDTLKKIKVEGNYLHLIPLNPSFEPVTVKKRDVNFAWKVVKVIKEM
jgi:repressor LexA